MVAMRKTGLLAGLAAVLACSTLADEKLSTIRLRDVDFKGTMAINGSLSLTATFDVQKEDLYDELYIDFYILLEPDDNDRGPQFLHCRTIHRFLEEQTGYTSGVVLPAEIMNCIDPDDSEYAVVLTCRGEEVGMDNSMKERWWESEKLGKPIENVLIRATRAPTVRPWESE